MIIVCAADKCAGALICDILNGTQSPIIGSIIHNKLNSLLKSPIYNQWYSPDTETQAGHVETQWVKLPKNEKEWLQVSEKYLNNKDIPGFHTRWLFPGILKPTKEGKGEE